MVIKNLTSAVEESEDKFLQVKLAKLYQKMDRFCAISDQTLMQIVTAPIDVTSNMKYKRLKNKHLRERRAKSSTFMAIEDIEEEEDELSFESGRHSEIK